LSVTSQHPSCRSRVVAVAKPPAKPFMTMAEFAAYALREAKRGHTYPLIARVSWCSELTQGERQFIEDLLLEANRGHGKAEVRRTESGLIRAHFDELIKNGSKVEAAVSEIMQVRGRSRAHVFKALQLKTRS
jgi:hypothetical protein